MLLAGKEESGQVNIQRGIFQGECLSPLPFVIYLLPISIVLRKCRAGYPFERGQEEVNHLLFMDDIVQLFAEYERKVAR